MTQIPAASRREVKHQSALQGYDEYFTSSSPKTEPLATSVVGSSASVNPTTNGLKLSPGTTVGDAAKLQGHRHLNSVSAMLGDGQMVHTFVFAMDTDAMEVSDLTEMYKLGEWRTDDEEDKFSGLDITNQEFVLGGQTAGSISSYNRDQLATFQFVKDRKNGEWYMRYEQGGSVDTYDDEGLSDSSGGRMQDDRAKAECVNATNNQYLNIHYYRFEYWPGDAEPYPWVSSQ